MEIKDIVRGGIYELDYERFIDSGNIHNSHFADVSLIRIELILDDDIIASGSNERDVFYNVFNARGIDPNWLTKQVGFDAKYSSEYSDALSQFDDLKLLVDHCDELIKHESTKNGFASNAPAIERVKKGIVSELDFCTTQLEVIGQRSSGIKVKH